MTEYEECIAHELSRRSKCCINYCAIEHARHNGKTGCRREVSITEKAISANGGSRLGIALRLPCDGAKNPLFTCPWFEEMGVEQARDEMTRLREAGARTLRRLARQLHEREDKN